MGDKYGSGVRGDLIVFFIHSAFRNGIKGRGRLVQNDAGRILIKKPCQQQLLLFPAGKVHGVGEHVSLKRRVLFHGKAADFLCKTGCFQALPQLPAVDLLLCHGAGDVAPYGQGQQIKILWNKAEGAVQFIPVVFKNGMAVDQHLALVGQEQAAHQHGQRGFSGAVQTHQRDLFPGIDLEGHMIQDLLFTHGVFIADILNSMVNGPFGVGIPSPWFSLAP